MKTYKLIFEDKKGNEIETKNITAYNLKDARRQKDVIFANSQINDLHKIKIGK